MKKELQNAREEYQKYTLSIDNVKADPIDQFEIWLAEYRAQAELDFNAMTLSTVGEDGMPSSRVVLLKGLSQSGFEFFTNYNSHKGKEMDLNPRVALNFYWPNLERQVRVQGEVTKLTDGESDAYFASRPYGSQIAAWTSPQSEVLSGRHEMEERQRYYEEKFGDKVPRPPHWGGYRVIPATVEFWQGRSSRLHDRVCYTRHGDSWGIERLAP